jgi:hypothetical protein
LVEDFEIREICLFPDKIFSFSDMESAVVIGRRPKTSRSKGETLSFRRVRERDVEEFKKSYKVTERRLIEQDQYELAPNWDLRIPEIEDAWAWCRQHTEPLDAIAELGQGFAFQGKNLPQNSLTYSLRRFSGAVPGFVQFPKAIYLHELPPEHWLNLDPKVLLRLRTGTTTGVSQVLLNYGPVGRGPWRLKALIDKDGHAVTSRFITVRPRSPDIVLEFLWAILNSPVANAFAYAHLRKRDNQVGIIRKTPVPILAKGDTTRVARTARRYWQAVSGLSGAMKATVDAKSAREQLERVDAEVLRLYKLPANLERQLLDLFATWPRPGVPFNFDRYYPEHFQEVITYQEFLQITEDWSDTNKTRIQLIHKELGQGISREEHEQLERLQTLADYRIRLIAPLPLREAEQVKNELVATEA